MNWTVTVAMAVVVIAWIITLCIWRQRTIALKVQADGLERATVAILRQKQLIDGLQTSVDVLSQLIKETVTAKVNLDQAGITVSSSGPTPARRKPSSVSVARIQHPGSVNYGEFKIRRRLSKSQHTIIETFARQVAEALTARLLREEQEFNYYHDRLTGLPNNLAFHRSLDERLSSHPGWTMVGLLDMDDFKQINDTQGHQEGDRQLKLLGKALQEAIDTTGVCARLHGDEFAFWVSANGKNMQELRKMLSDIHERLTTSPDNPIHVSLGAAIIFSQTPTSEAMLWADQVMYHCKRKGKNQWDIMMVKPESVLPNQDLLESSN